MVDCPKRHNTVFFIMDVGGKKRRQVVESERYMFHACLRTISVTKLGHVDEADTMMLLVICHEADLIVLIGRRRRQDGGVEALHLREPRSAQDDMRQFRRNGAE